MKWGLPVLNLCDTVGKRKPRFLTFWLQDENNRTNLIKIRFLKGIHVALIYSTSRNGWCISPLFRKWCRVMWRRISCLAAHQGPGYLNSMQIVKFLIIGSIIPHPETLSERTGKTWASLWHSFQAYINDGKLRTPLLTHQCLLHP